MTPILEPVVQPRQRLATPLPPSAEGDAAKRWLAAIAAPSVAVAQRMLAEIYRDSPPSLGELVFTGECTFKCKHCIYAPDFPRFNKEIPPETWGAIFAELRAGAGIQTYVYGGRAVTEAGLDVLIQLRRAQPAASIGLIDNGISMLPLRDRVLEVAADWIDISLDGTEEAHDLQRGRSGSFKAGLEGALWLVRNGAAPRVNILTCATTINHRTIVPMIRELHGRGFRNFFVTPVTIVEGQRPDPGLRLAPDQFVSLVHDLHKLAGEISDVWIEVGMFSVEYADYVAASGREYWSHLAPEGNALTWEDHITTTSSGFCLRYYPISLTGTRELIVNTNGDVLVPQSMARGKIESDAVVGSILAEGIQSLLQRLPSTQAFSFYQRELIRESQLLRRYF